MSTPPEKKPEEVQDPEAERALLDKIALMMGPGAARKFAEKKQKEHKFWDTQPVPKLGEEKPAEIGPMENKTLEDVPKEPYPIAKGYEWFDMDIFDEEGDMERLYHLLEGHYVEDSDAMFRFAYPKEFLKWALTPPGWRKDWHVGVRVAGTNKLVAFISAVPATMNVEGKDIPMVEINFLCVTKELRAKRLAPLLIKEITRRVNLTDVWQAVYTAGVLLPRPVASCTYWHRSLNPTKLIAIRFSAVPQKFRKFSNPMQQVNRYYSLPDKPAHPVRPMEKKDVSAVHALVSQHLSKFKIHPVFSEEEFEHWLLPRDGVIQSFVVEREGKVTDFFSFYVLPSSVIGNDKYKVLNAAYSYYNVATSMSFEELMNSALIVAKSMDMDVFNALDLMDNGSVFENLKFGIGDGHLQYYLFNYAFPQVEPKELALVML